MGPLLVAALIDGASYTLAFTTIAVIRGRGPGPPVVTKPRRGTSTDVPVSPEVAQ